MREKKAVAALFEIIMSRSFTKGERMCVCVCAILVKEQEEVLHTDSNKEYAFDKTTSASCVFYTKTSWFPDFLDVMCPQTEATQVNSTTAQCTTKRAAHK